MAVTAIGIEIADVSLEFVLCKLWKIQTEIRMACTWNEVGRTIERESYSIEGSGEAWGLY